MAASKRDREDDQRGEIHRHTDPQPSYPLNGPIGYSHDCPGAPNGPRFTCGRLDWVYTTLRSL